MRVLSTIFEFPTTLRMTFLMLSKPWITLELFHLKTNTGQYVLTYSPPPLRGGIEKDISQLGKGKNNLTSILPYIMTFVIEYQGYFMIFPSNFVSKEHFLEYYL